ncbi:MAG: hypothetical protein K1X72_00655 [Pyrinomonadaceae bacterium]|nr:hypothetical protein [Pyrinomonadaceae bacterium]
MRSLLVKLALITITCLFGLLSVWCFGVLEEMLITLQKGVPVNPDSMKPQKIDAFAIRRVWFKNGKGFVEVSAPENKRFIPYARGCKPGYSQSYITNEGDFMNEGVTPMNEKQLKKFLKNAEVIERVENAKNRHGDKGVRFITKNISKNGETYYEILWYGGNLLFDITAPTLELALEFENANAYAY